MPAVNPGSAPNPGPARGLLGERLRARGLVTAGQLDLALREQRRTAAPLGETLLQLGFLAAPDLAGVLAEQGGVPFLDREAFRIEPEAVALLPESLARRLRVLPLDRSGRELRVAMADIFDLDAVAEVEGHTLLRVRVAACTEEDLQAGLAQAYGERRSLEELIEEAIQRAEEGRGEPAVDPPVARLVDQLLRKALRDRATDLHLQPDERTVLTRFRVDGSLVQGPSLPKALQGALLARLKVMAEVDIAEARRPQDGRFRLPHGRGQLDIRASFLPAQHGEKAVLRILDKTNLILGLDRLGMPPWVLDRFNAMLARPGGLILVTGPTGSGKTTTLYSALHHLNRAEHCIITVEDPVEYQLPLITQVALNPKAGLTFATGLRSILRQDPDIILVGEIRDAETAAMALRAAMTGHLVLSTLHTSDPVGAIARMKDLGASDQELAASVLGIHAQRLVRLTCRACARPCDPPPGLAPEPAHWLSGAGCPICGLTGVAGRRAIHDLLPVAPGVRERIAAGAPLAEIEAAARLLGKGSLFEHALELARAGLISPAEALRVTAAEA